MLLLLAIVQRAAHSRTQKNGLTSRVSQVRPVRIDRRLAVQSVA